MGDPIAKVIVGDRLAAGERDLRQRREDAQATARMIRIERVVDRRERCVAHIDDAEGDQCVVKCVVDLEGVVAALGGRVTE
jgi:hypothetical protein